MCGQNSWVKSSLLNGNPCDQELRTKVLEADLDPFQICHIDQLKIAWSETDFCVSGASCITALLKYLRYLHEHCNAFPHISTSCIGKNTKKS